MLSTVKSNIILDHDIGTNPDDFFSLLILQLILTN